MNPIDTEDAKRGLVENLRLAWRRMVRPAAPGVDLAGVNLSAASLKALR